MSDLEVLQNVILSLNGINVPVEYMKTIGVPLYNAQQQLIGLYQAVIEKAKQQQAAKKQEEEVKADE